VGLGLHLPNPNATKANDKQGNSLEALLATKNKRILEELTKFRVSDLGIQFVDIQTSHETVDHAQRT
jgi:hypothetical protein